MSTVEDLQRQLREAQELIDRQRRENEQMKQRDAPTRFLDYVRNVEQHMFATFSVEPDSTKTSTISETSVNGKFYPQHFQPWTEFAAIHKATFDSFTTTFADNACFPTLNFTAALGQDLSPKVSNEFSLFPFLRASIEKPAATIVTKYLEISGHDKFKSVKFHGNAYGMTLEGKGALELSVESLTEPASKRRSLVRDIGVPDRWLQAHSHDGKVKYALVGEVKPAHALNGVKLNRVLSAPPGDDFFLRATRQDGLSKSGQVPGEAYIAKVFCQGFHYMISSGLEFGYIASGDGLVFFRIPEDDPNTLYYFWSVFEVNRNREPCETALAHLATLSILSIEFAHRSAGWIDATANVLRRWPKSTATVPSLAETPLPLLPHDKDSDGGSGGGGGASGSGGGNASGSASGGESRPGTQSALKRSRSHGSRSSTTTGGNTTGAHGAQQARRKGPFIVEPPTLPYCTHACLRSLCYGQTLDKNCPNVELHQAVARCKDSHALTADEVRTRVVAQLADNMDKDCKSFFFDGRLGRYGVLFKITLTGFGYTFVAKAVQDIHRRVLQHEVTIYTALQDFQGRLIPVCLGLIDLERPIPLGNCQWVSHMMLMSHAGGDVRSNNVQPGVDFDLEAEKTRQELYAAGMSNNDTHNGNIAWNEELLRVIEFDFDDAYLRFVREPLAAVLGASPQKSPLQVKRNLITDHEDNEWGGNGQIKKRARTAV